MKLAKLSLCLPVSGGDLPPGLSVFYRVIGFKIFFIRIDKLGHDLVERINATYIGRPHPKAEVLRRAIVCDVLCRLPLPGLADIWMRLNVSGL